jgi:hypothetical protein
MISEQDVNYFSNGSSIYSRSYEIASEYLDDDTFILFPFMCDLSLPGEVPHIKGWPPIPDYGRCGSGGSIPYEQVNPGNRFESIFFFFQNKGWHLNKYIDGPKLSPSENKQAISKLIDSVLCKTLYPYFEHSEKRIEKMQNKYVCPAKVEPALSFLCEKINCVGIDENCFIGLYLNNQWGLNGNFIQHLE